MAEAEPPPPPPSSMSFWAVLALSFTFGFFETFSPCLIAMLSFVLAYSAGDEASFWARFGKVMVFAVGFVAATVVVFSVLALGVAGLSVVLGVQFVMMWVICVVALVLGFHLLGFSVFKLLKVEVETKPVVQRLTRRYALSFLGLAFLGFLFYFLDPCLAPVFVAMLGTFEEALLLESLAVIVFVFCLGVILPFFFIGLLAGSISRLARSAYRQKARIRALSGLILIGYAIYLIVTYLLSQYGLP
ncbi:MAG: cytochrome c biogenesis protein CcdA [Candidatus Bathyarchaeia archaeon]